MLNEDYNIAIVGMGPKGLYALSTLIKRLNRSLQSKVRIFLFEKSGAFGRGFIYQRNQPDYFLMNYENVHIDHSMMYNSSEQALSFSEFVGSWEGFSSRWEVGDYLAHLYDHIKNKAGSFVEIIESVDEVTDITKSGSSFQIKTKNDQVGTVKFKNILITTGHQTCHSARSDENFDVDLLYPIKPHLSKFTSADTVIIKGLGLTFIDAVLALTEGRGGRFEKNEDDRLVYRSSENDVQSILAYSRSGALMLPRKTTILPQHFELQYFKWEELQSSNQIFDFDKHILPVIKEEYNLQNNDSEIVFEDALDLSSYSLNELVIIAEEEKLSGSYLISLIWRKFASDFNDIYKNRGLTSSSHRRFDQHWKSIFQRLSYGPPIINYKKLLAVQKSNILNLEFRKSPTIDQDKMRIITIDGSKQATYTRFVNGRVPSSDINNYPSRLYKRLLSSGLIRLAFNGDYNIGCVDVDEDGNCIDQRGSVNNSLTFYGIPTEGLTYNNDTLSVNHNSPILKWADHIEKEINDEHDNTNTNSSSLDEASFIQTKIIKRAG